MDYIYGIVNYVAFGRSMTSKIIKQRHTAMFTPNCQPIARMTGYAKPMLCADCFTAVWAYTE